jgi:hypothetical protein
MISATVMPVRAGGLVQQGPDTRPVVSIWNYDHMVEVRRSLKQGNKRYTGPYQRLLRESEAILRERPTSVMDKPDEKVAKSKDKHDFVSVGKYAWPNPNTPDGMPWVQRDGYINVDNFRKDDAARLDKMSNRVSKLCMAYFFSDDPRFAEKAAELVRVWFVDTATRMNPELTYAQVIPGHDNDMGHIAGVIFGRTLVNVLAGLALIQHTAAYTADIDQGVKRWFGEYAGWLTTSGPGIGEGRTTNNHSIAYDEQLIAVALFEGDTASARRLTAEFHPKRIFRQVEPDGKMPRELARTRALGYSIYNVKNMLEICEMVKGLNASFYFITSPDGRSIGSAIDYIVTYLGKKESDFRPYQQVADWDKCMDDLCWIVKRASRNDKSRNYGDLFKQYATNLSGSINNLLY